MKSSTCFSLAIAVLLNACQEDDGSVSAGTKGVFTVDEVVAQAAASAPVALGPDDHIIDVNFAETDTIRWEETGPFSTTVPMARVFTHRYVILTPAEGYDNGVYLCDIYIATAEITLPPKALLVRANATQEGYTTYQGDAKTKGIAVYETSGDSTYTMYTWSIVPKYDPLGHQLDDSPLPNGLMDVTFNYSYYQPG